MNYWIFQGNPDTFNVDAYLNSNTEILWTVRQKHLAEDMRQGDEVFIWRASGKRQGVAGIVAIGELAGDPTLMQDDPASRDLWVEEDPESLRLRVRISLGKVSTGAKQIVRRDWLRDDPVASQLRILKLSAETNYRISQNEAQRIAILARNTGRDWNREESIAGLWAYAHTLDKPVSKLAGAPVTSVALSIGRTVSGVYNKVMNFRAIDPNDDRAGFSRKSQVDDEVWSEFFDTSTQRIQRARLDEAYGNLWGAGLPRVSPRASYQDFGDAPNDDPEELQQFAARVRRGQPAFRRNLLSAYGQRCALTGHGPSKVLEAVHIVPHAESGINELDNGLLMRADLHSLFDANLIHIEPHSMQISLDDSLHDTPYGLLHGQKVRQRVDGTQIGSMYLKQRWDKMSTQPEGP